MSTSTPARPRSSRPRVDQRALSVVYVLVLVVVIFGAWQPDRFLVWDNLAAILNNSAISGLVALALMLPLASGLFDFSVGYSLGFSAVLVAWILGNTGASVTVAVLLTLVASAMLGALNGLVVVVFKIDSFIGTLATGSVLLAGILMVSNNQILTAGLQDPHFLDLAQRNANGVTLPVIYLLVVTVALWYFLGHTASGRRIYATGRSLQAARLAGVGTDRLRFIGLVASATISGFAGILVTAQLGAGSPQIGPSYLIPAYAAAFLGLAQSPRSLFNPWGTVSAVLLLATVSAGLALAGAPLWAPYVFTGAVLIAAIGISGVINGRSRAPRRKAPSAGTEASQAAHDEQLTAS